MWVGFVINGEGVQKKMEKHNNMDRAKQMLK